MSHVTQGGSGDDDDDDDDDDASDDGDDDDDANTNLFLFLDNAIVRSPNAQRLRNVVLRGLGSYILFGAKLLLVLAQVHRLSNAVQLNAGIGSIGRICA